MKKLITVILLSICFVLLSAALFLCTYEYLGFSATSECLMMWGFALTAFVLALGLFVKCVISGCLEFLNS